MNHKFKRKVTDNGKNRIVCWFSCGAASAVATKLALREYDRSRIYICYTDPGSEHPDNLRFLKDCENWFDHPVTILKNDKYDDTWAVWEDRKYVAGISGAPCTVELKKSVRQRFEQFDDIQVFGYTQEELHRAERFREQNQEVMLDTPLIRHGLGKGDCLAMVEKAGIKLPVVYEYMDHANCIPCSKASGVAYWQRIKKHHPLEFERYAELCDRLGVKQIKVKGERKSLRELPEDEYPWEPEPIECSLMCQIAENEE
jgi:PP-loop superfamily ATP-utilizing enzyme